uniref:EH domain-containing protein n=1 Tax=Amphiprion ocellaris TaxID=80972 RepID=A0AAQ5XF75_AMPOC
MSAAYHIMLVCVSAGMVPMQQQQQQQQQQQGFPMVPVMQPNMQGMMGMNFGGQMPPGAIPMQGGLAIGMQTPGMQFLGQPQFMGMRPAGPQYTADIQKQMAEEHQKRLEQQQKMLEEDRKRRQFEEQKQKLRLLSSVKPKTGEKSRDEALEAIRGNLDGFSRDAKMHPTPSSQTKKPDSSPSHPSVTTHSLPPALSEDNDEFSDFQGPVDAPASFPPPSSSTSSTFGLSSQAHAQPSSSSPKTGFSADDDEFSDFVQGPVNAFSSSSFHLSSQAQVQPSPPSSHSLPESLPAFVSIPTATQHSAVNTSSQSTFQAGVGVYPQQEHIQSMLPAWVYNDSLVPEMFKKVLEFTMTPAGIDTAKLYPILMSSGLPREALGQIWASANRTTPGMLTKEELYTVLALIGVAQSGLPAMNVEILGQFPSPPVPNLPALAMAMAPVMPQHQQPMMTQPPVSMAMPTPAPPVMAMAPAAPAPPPTNTNFIASFPPAQVTTKTSVLLFPVADDIAHFNHDCCCREFLLSCHYVSVLCLLLILNSCCWFAGEGFADFKSVSADDGFTDFKTADSVSPLDPSDQSLQQLPQQQQPQVVSPSQPKNPLNMADLDLFSSIAPSVPATTETKPSTFPSVSVPPSLVLLPGGAKPPGGGADDFGDFALFGSSSDATQASAAGGAAAAPQDDFADFMAFGSSGGEPKGESSAGVQAELSIQQRPQQSSDKYDVFKQLSLEGGLAYDDTKESGGGSFSSLKSDTDDFADFQSSKFCTALGASEKTLVDKVAAFKQAKEDSASVKSLDLPSISGSSVGKDDSEDALSVQLDMKLSDMGGDLKHVMSDSSLDLPGLSAHQPPATGEELDGSSADDKFEAFADFGPGEHGGVDDGDDFGDFASTVSEKSDSLAATGEAGSEGNQSEASDDFGAFQGDKPKFGKSDFLKASAQAKVKSSEEMIKNELATFDLSVQGSHKRSHSLGDKEIGRSPPSPAPEQSFRDRSNTLNEKSALPVIRDKYKDLTGEVEESERYAYEWQRCLESALEVITKANNTLNSISSSSVCTEVIQSAQGMEYLLGVVEVYRVTRRVELGIKATAVCSEKLQQLLKDISRMWNNLIGFMSLAKLAPDESSLDFSSCILRHGIKNAKEVACGVCLLNVDARSKAFNSETDNFKLLYGGHQYHASCANFWINCVEPKPPGLILPDLL